MAAPDDDITLEINSVVYGGWTDVKITRGIEICPNSFSIALTDLFPGDGSKLTVQPGDPCVVRIGSDVVITGFVDRFLPSIAAQNHAITITGRGKCQDLVDCSAEWDGGQIVGSSALQIAQKLAAPYGITVSAPAGVDVGPPIPKIALVRPTPAFDIIESVCRYRGLLAYEGTDGNLILAQAGADTMASGFVEGEGGNVQEAAGTYAMDERFQTYEAFLTSVEIYADAGGPSLPSYTATDPGVKRHRLRYIIAEAGGGLTDLLKQRALWEAARRAGRGSSIAITADCFRDSAGKLWTPNAVVPVVDIPDVKPTKEDWTISSVVFGRDGVTGTTAKIVVMPKKAFVPEPILLLPFAADINDATNN